MQTPISPILPSSSSPASSAPKAAAPAPEQQFQRTLSRQIEQRQALTQSQNQAQAKNAEARSADARTKADAKTAANAASPSKTALPPAPPSADAKPAEADPKPDGEADDHHDDAATQPLSDMLSLVASLQQAASTLKGKAEDGATTKAGSGADRSAAALLGVDKAAAALLVGNVASDKAAAALLGGNAASDKAAAVLLGDSATSDKAAAVLLGDSTTSDKAAAALLTTESDSFDAKLAASAPTALPKAGALDAALPGTVNLVAPTAQAALQIAQAASAVTTDKLNGQVGSPAWDQQLGQKVVWMAAGGMQSATLTLNPPDLGPLQVVLNVSNDQASVSFTSAQPEVRQALEAAMPKLREMMGEAGVSLGNTSVSEGNANQGHGGAQQERARQSGAARGESAMVQAISVPMARGAALQGMVDTFA
jgi:flagellar hook-length control protein FliK